MEKHLDECPKCLAPRLADPALDFINFNIKWQPEIITRRGFTIRAPGGKECLIVACDRCGFSWDEPCYDAVD